MIKAMRAANYVPNKIKFPVWAEPKIDGFRGLNMGGTLTARTLKKFKNKYTTEFFSKPEYIGFDGELAAQDERHPDLCRITNSAVNSIEGEPFVLWHIFDYVTEETRHWSYKKRKIYLADRIAGLQLQGKCGHLRVVPHVVCENLEQLMAAHSNNMELGYEGTCFYGPDVAHKEGKSSPTHNGVLRIKDFVDTEAEVLQIVEGEENLNEAQINELGRTYRTSHQANKIPNGMVGCLICRQLEDVYDPLDDKKLLIPKDKIIKVSPGKMTKEDRMWYYHNPNEIVGQPIKHKFFPRGMKDKPRFSNFQMIRPKEDMF